MLCLFKLQVEAKKGQKLGTPKIRDSWPFPIGGFSGKGILKEMLAISYLVLRACFLFLRRFRQKWRTSVLPCSHTNAVAHVLILVGDKCLFAFTFACGL